MTILAALLTLTLTAQADRRKNHECPMTLSS